MKVPRPRFTVRWLMASVALVAIVLSMNLFRERSRRFERIAKEFAQREEFAASLNREAPNPDGLMHWINTNTGSFQVKPKNVAYYSEMRIKYERLRYFPWLPVAADPPEPK